MLGKIVAAIVGGIVAVGFRELIAWWKARGRAGIPTFSARAVADAGVIYRSDRTEVVVFVECFSRVADTLFAPSLTVEWPELSQIDPAEPEACPSHLTLSGSQLNEWRDFARMESFSPGEGKNGRYYFCLGPRESNSDPKITITLRTGRGQKLSLWLPVTSYHPESAH